jgi:CheY-like chemotaxis protein
MVDGVRLRQILLNLCSNAVKFSPRGSVTVSCELLERQGPECSLRFTVKDTGIGIADCSALFQEFTQADASTTRRYGGTGLGLAICKRLVERMGGKIAAESVLGRGSKFYFELQLRECDAVANDTKLFDEVLPVPVNGSALVVDDNVVNRMVAQKLLERMGWRVTLACSGYEALELARGKDFDLIFMDCQMPEMDGYQATRALIAERPLHPPIIALTANASPDDRDRCLEAGMQDFLAKPVRAQDLRAVVSRWATRLTRGRP